ncbi:MAG: glycosyltransferase family 39 protein [Candidatus Micrarchaeaceae archaeon]
MSSSFCYPFLNIVPLAASMSVFGVGNIQAIIPSIIEYSLLIFITFFVAYRTYGRYFAFAGSIMVATAPFVVGYVTRVLSDINVGLAVAVSIFLFLLSVKRRSAAISFLSGLAAIYTIYIKSDGIIYVVLFIIANILAFRNGFGIFGKHHKSRKYTEQKRDAKNLLLSIGGVAIGFALFIFAFYLAFGDPMFPFEYYTLTASSIKPLEELYILFSPLQLNALVVAGAYELFPLGPVAILSAIGTLIGLKNKDSTINYVSFFGWGIFLYLIFGTASLHEYLFPPVVSRFFGIEVLPFGLLSGYALFSIYSFLKKRTRIKESALKFVFTLFVAAVLFSYLPMYKNFVAYEVDYKAVAMVISATANYIMSNPTGNVTQVYLNSDWMWELNQIQFFNFATKYNKSISAHMIDYERLGGLNTSNLCQKSIAVSHQYVVVIGNGYEEYTSAEQLQNLQGWLGANCTISLVEEINSEPTNSIIATYIYKVFPYTSAN